MAVLTVTKSWKTEVLNATRESADTDVIYDVTFEGTENPDQRILLAYNAVDPSTGIRVPEIGTPNPFNNFLAVASKRIDRIGPLDFRVFCTYSTRNIAGNNTSSPLDPLANPILQPPEVQWGITQRQESIDRDIKGKPICNSAGESYTTPLTEDFYDRTLTITRNQYGFNQKWYDQYHNSVNIDLFWGNPQGWVKCVGITADSCWQGKFFYWKVRFSFVIRVGGWAQKKVDQGYNEWVSTDAAGKRVLKPITGKDGAPGTILAYLNGSGYQTKAGTITGGPAPIFVNEYQTKLYKPFAPLML